MTARFLKWLQGLIASGNTHPFYVSGEWRSLSAYVLEKIDKNECQICKARKKYRKAIMVHHVNHVKRRPDLALDIWYIDADGNKRRNLISVCRQCHETVCHPERMHKKKAEKFQTEERWD